MGFITQKVKTLTVSVVIKKQISKCTTEKFNRIRAVLPRNPVIHLDLDCELNPIGAFAMTGR